MRWRWLRLAGPITGVVTLSLVTVIAHTVERADPTDRAFLSPTATGDIGASRLAARLGARGVTVERVTSTPAAIGAAAPGDATIFVPAPALVYDEYLPLLTAGPPDVRVVLVAPDPATLAATTLDVRFSGPRWTAAVPPPSCREAWAAGRAAVRRWRYAAGLGGRIDCYAGGMVEIDRGGSPVTLVGASDPFRNDRIGEHANAAVAVGLLSRGRRVIWLDLHDRERPPPRPRPDPTGPTQAPPPPADPPPDESEAGPSITDAFPPAFWATLLMLALAAIALAAAAGRRLGAPVAEPLPVRVRAAETVRGLGGLYRRARADVTSLATIQAAARRRLAGHLGLPPDSSGADIARRLPGMPPEQVARVLDDPGQDLASTAEAVQNLVRHVKGNVT